MRQSVLPFGFMHGINIAIQAADKAEELAHALGSIGIIYSSNLDWNARLQLQFIAQCDTDFSCCQSILIGIAIDTRHHFLCESRANP